MFIVTPLQAAAAPAAAAAATPPALSRSEAEAFEAARLARRRDRIRRLAPKQWRQPVLGRPLPPPLPATPRPPSSGSEGSFCPPTPSTPGTPEGERVPLMAVPYIPYVPRPATPQVLYDEPTGPGYDDEEPAEPGRPVTAPPPRLEGCGETAAAAPPLRPVTAGDPSHASEDIFHELRSYFDPQYRLWCVRKEVIRMSRRHRLGPADMFAAVDVDGSGAIDRAEVKQMVQSVGVRVKEMELVTLMSILDADGSGDADLDEFIQWCVLLRPLTPSPPR